MATQGLHGPAAARADDEPSAVAVSFDHPVVTGGFLKKPWVPEVLLNHAGEAVQHQGAFFTTVSANNYGLAQFLFGKVNAQGKARHLEYLQVFRNIWKATLHGVSKCFE